MAFGQDGPLGFATRELAGRVSASAVGLEFVQLLMQDFDELRERLKNVEATLTEHSRELLVLRPQNILQIASEILCTEGSLRETLPKKAPPARNGGGLCIDEGVVKAPPHSAVRLDAPDGTSVGAAHAQMLPVPLPYKRCPPQPPAQSSAPPLPEFTEAAATLAVRAQSVLAFGAAPTATPLHFGKCSGGAGSSAEPAWLSPSALLPNGAANQPPLPCNPQPPQHVAVKAPPPHLNRFEASVPAPPPPRSAIHEHAPERFHAALRSSTPHVSVAPGPADPAVEEFAEVDAVCSVLKSVKAPPPHLAKKQESAAKTPPPLLVQVRDTFVDKSSPTVVARSEAAECAPEAAESAAKPAAEEDAPVQPLPGTIAIQEVEQPPQEADCRPPPSLEEQPQVDEASDVAVAAQQFGKEVATGEVAKQNEEESKANEAVAAQSEHPPTAEVECRAVVPEPPPAEALVPSSSGPPAQPPPEPLAVAGQPPPPPPLAGAIAANVPPLPCPPPPQQVARRVSFQDDASEGDDASTGSARSSGAGGTRVVSGPRDAIAAETMPSKPPAVAGHKAPPPHLAGRDGGGMAADARPTEHVPVDEA